MKKSFKMVAKLLAMFASACMLFGMVACSDDGDDDNNSSSGGGGGGTPVASVSLNPTTGTLYQDVEEGDSEHSKTLTLTPTVQNSDAAIVWSVDKDGIVTLKKGEDTITAETETASGEAITVEAEGVGEVTVTAKLKGTDKSATAKITVYANTYTEEVLKGIAGKYLAGETKIIIAENGTVTVGDKSSDEPGTVTKNQGDTYTASVTIDSTVYELTVTKSGEAYTVTKAKIGDGEEVDVEEYKPVTLKNGTTETKYSTVKEALKAIPSTATASDTYTIKLLKDTYEEDGLTYSGNASITIEGDTTTEYGTDVVIKGKGSSQAGTAERCLLYFAKNTTSNLTLKNVTLQNTIKRAEVTETNASGNKLTQAEALGFDSKGKLIAYNSSFISHQDTVRTVGKSWFYKCHIEGDVDFVWISDANSVVLLEECNIEIASDESTSAYILGGRIAESNIPVAKGHVILGGKITVPSESTSAYLFRHPGGENCWSQGAVVGAEIDGTFTALAKSAANETDDKQFVAWKVDSAIADANEGKLTYVGTLSDRYENREYNGRYVILNRVYNTTKQKFETVATADLWDPASELTVNSGDSITEDKSKNKIFLDYADVTKTSIGDELVVSDYSTTAPTVSWSAKAYSSYENGTLSDEVNGVTINETSGKITNNYSGNVYVEVTATKGTGDSASSDSIVLYSVTATKIKLDASEATIAIGSTKTLTASFEPEGATADVEWTSSDTNVEVKDGVVTVKDTATVGSTAKITAKIKDTNISATCTVTVAAAAYLYKFGVSVDNVSAENYTNFGKNEYLVYKDVVITSETKATITAKITYTNAGKEIGVGFVSFADGAYSDGIVSRYSWVTPNGCKSTAGGQGFDDSVKSAIAAATGEMTLTATISGGTVSYTLTSGILEGSKSGSNFATYYFTIPSDYVYLALGGTGEAGDGTVSASDISIKIGDGDAMTVAGFKDLEADTKRTALTASGSVSYELTAEKFSSSSKGDNATITLSEDLLTGLSVTPSVEGKWSWDTESVVSTGGADTTATARFIPTDRTAHKAIIGYSVSIAVTDNRTAASANAFSVAYLDSVEHVSLTDIVSTDSKTTIAKGGKGVLSSAQSIGSWSVTTDKMGNNNKKQVADLTSALTFTTTASTTANKYDEIYIDFPVTAVAACTIKKIVVSYGNHGTDNTKGAFFYKKSTEADFTKITDNVATRNLTVEQIASISLSANETVTIRVALGGSSSTVKDKSPTISTVTISGE